MPVFRPRTIAAAASAIGMIALPAIAAQVGADARRAGDEPSPRDSAMVALLIDDQLEPSIVHLVGIDGDEVIYLDQGGVRRSAQITGLAALLPTDAKVDASKGVGAVANAGVESPPRAWTEATDVGLIELVDGQRYPGRLASLGDEEESILWSHPAFEQIQFPLERISRVINERTRYGMHSRMSAPPLEDEIVLANGDLLSGFIINLADPVEIESENNVVQVPRDRVQEARFANPQERLRGLVVWLGDGTVASVEQLRYSSGAGVSVMLTGGETGLYESTALRAVAFDAGELLPLSELEPIRQNAVGDRRRVIPISRRLHPDDRFGTASSAMLDARDIILPGPMEVVFVLPAGTSRLATTAALAPNTEPWGDCELVIIEDGREIIRHRLHQGNPVSAINIELSGRELTIRVEPGAYGPILDRVMLHRPLLLVREQGL